MALSNAVRIKNYRTRQKEKGASDSSHAHKNEYKKSQRLSRPFVGCDGEGCGADEMGRQNYMLLRIGDRELYTGECLKTWDCLDFICDSPRNGILVGFSFGYDVTMILRDLSNAQKKRLFEKREIGPGISRSIWYKDFDIEYLPKNYFKVKRVRIVRDPATGTEKRIPIKNSQRTIYETFGFFQKSFLNACKSFEIGSKDEIELLEYQKSRRSEFETISQEERNYCSLECEFLSALMSKLRLYCYDAGIVPQTWNGAGKLAKALMKSHKVPVASEMQLVPSGVWDFANMAYYGGRFEISRLGLINETIFEYDIKSAYPAAQSIVPCLVHGAWSKTKIVNSDDLYIASCTFSKKPDVDEWCELGALPIRSKEGHLYWPLNGGGVYWGCEIESAKRRGFKVKCSEIWKFEKRCHCQPFGWIEELFDYRVKIGSNGPGYPIKLGINSLYGITAQRVGNGKFNNMIYAGFITAMTRAKLNDAIALNPKRICMIATDAVYSLDPLDLPCGERLGQWEGETLDGLFICQPGLYWSPNKRKKKSRGLSGKFFENNDLTIKFENSFANFLYEQNSNLEAEFPKVSVPVPGFIGLKLACARNKPEIAGTWVNDHREISFDYRNKRTAHKICGNHILTKPKFGSIKTLSLPHKDFLAEGGAETWEAARMALDEQPDYVDLGIPFKD